jgi:hypothetical protein
MGLKLSAVLVLLLVGIATSLPRLGLAPAAGSGNGGRLRHAQSGGGAAEVQLLRDGEEVAQVSQLHRTDPYLERLNCSRLLYWTAAMPSA